MRTITKSKPLLALILLLAMFLSQKIFNTLFAVKTRISIEPNPLQEGADMLRFLKRTVKLALGTLITLTVLLILSVGMVAILAIQALAH